MSSEDRLWTAAARQGNHRLPLAPRMRGLAENGTATRGSSYIVAAWLAMLAIPAAITLHTVRIPATVEVSSLNPTPYGYTVSLLLFIVPILVIGCWFLPTEGLEIPQRAFWRTIAILFTFGVVLDALFAQRFFFFRNSGATLKILAPALGKWVPVEEYIFYLTGFIAVLLIYIWLDEFWLAAYNIADYPGEARRIDRLLRFHPASVVLGLVVIGVAVIYKKFLAGSHEGFPGYFTFLAAVGIVPAASFFPVAKPFINWRALSLTLFIILLISLFWEATLAIPYQWWGYQEAEMMGLSIGAWNGLPIEAVCVWIAVTFATVIVFETIKLWKASGRSAREAFLGHHGSPNDPGIEFSRQNFVERTGHMSETINFELALPNSGAEAERAAIEAAGGKIERAASFEPPRNEIDAYSRAHFEPMTAIFATAALVVLAERIVALIKEVSYPGLIAEMRDGRWHVRTNPSLRHGKVLVLGQSGAKSLDLGAHDSNLLAKVIDLLKVFH